MSLNQSTPERGIEQALASLLDLTRLARHARTEAELEFLLVNETTRLLPYRLAVLWRTGPGIGALSGLVKPDANAPYSRWVSALSRSLHRQFAVAALPRAFRPTDLPVEIANAWDEWWPLEAIWIPLPPAEADGQQLAAAPAMPHQPAATRHAGPATAALILVRDQAWTAPEQVLLQEWASAWWHAWVALRHRPRRSWLRPWRADPSSSEASTRPIWRRPDWWLAATAIVICGLPVRLTVLAPGELVPRDPFVLRAPLEGVIDSFQVQPNQEVREGQALFSFDEALIQARLNVAQQSLATATTEYRQVAQQSLTDGSVRPQLAVLSGRIKERSAEVSFLKDQLQRSRVLAPRAGIALFDDPNQWIGKPVVIGERILRIASPEDVEVEAWVAIGDAIEFPPGAQAHLFLNARPLEPVRASLRYMAHEATQRPDGTQAYRVRARLLDPPKHRVGLKGTVRLEGDTVPLIYWVLRRPISSLRTWFGI
jgi:hypothetical protein